VNILSAWNTGDGATNSISGTSMATPHVSGVAALYLQLFPTATAEQVEGGVRGADVMKVTAAVLCASTKNIVRSPGVDSPNRLLYSLFDGCVNATLPPPNAAPTTTPRPATPPGCSCTCPAPATTEPALPPGDTTAPSGDTPAPTTTVAGGTPPPSTAAPSPTSAAATVPQTTPGPNSPVTFTGTLTREGQGLAFLANGGAMVSKGKVLEGRLIGPSGTDFDLYVESEENLDGVVYWMRAGSSAGLSSNEFLSYTHRRDYPRKYRWVAYSYRGTGPFTLTIQSLA
jgi:subtilisin family serine protease